MIKLQNAVEAQPLSLINTTVKNPYLHAATSDNTRKAYRQDIAHYTKWGGLLPSTSKIILLYLQDFSKTLNPRTLSRRLVALKNWHTYQGFSDPTACPLVRKTLKGILNVHGQPKRRACALSLEQLVQMIAFLKQEDTLSRSRNNALVQVGFFGAFRASEIVGLQVEHITFVPEGMDVLIHRSKTDQIGEGQCCSIPYGDGDLCPVTALKAWCERANITQGHIFKSIDRHDNLSASPLSEKSVSAIIKTLAEICQFPNPNLFSSHSMRHGFATTASQKNASFVSIMRHGRWRNEGTVLAYIAEGQRFEANAAQVILKNGIPND